MNEFEVAHDDNPEELLTAGKNAILSAMKQFTLYMRKAIGGPGLTWAQIDYMIEEFKKKKPTIIIQNEEQ